MSDTVTGRVINVEEKEVRFGEETRFKYVTYVVEGTATKIFDCWSKRIKDFVGKDLPAGTTADPPKDPRYFPKLNLPKEGGSGGFSKGGGWKGRSPEELTATWNNTCIMQATDLLKSVITLHPDQAKSVDALMKLWDKVYTHMHSTSGPKEKAAPADSEIPF